MDQSKGSAIVNVEICALTSVDLIFGPPMKIALCWLIARTTSTMLVGAARLMKVKKSEQTIDTPKLRIRTKESSGHSLLMFFDQLLMVATTKMQLKTQKMP
jgi:hypothetical protein